jgi:monovalent cation:H+ antiporter, CPA1 family
MDQLLQTETFVILLVIVITLVAIAVRKFHIPYTVVLVLVGLLLPAQTAFHMSITPELILTIFIPPLAFEAAFHINFSNLRKDLLYIGLLAVPGVLITMALLGGLLAWLTGMGVALAFLFGALIAATDPVAVVALFRTLGVPKRLAVMIEGESLLNDGTAIVLFNLVLGIALAGQADWIGGIVDFFRISLVGLLIGWVLGWLVSRLIASIDDYLIETTLTALLAFGSYFLAERLQGSGVLAVVAAGLVCGNIGPRGMSPTTKVVLYHFWEYVAFLANSFVFLLIGMSIDIVSIFSNWPSIFIAILGMLLARAVIVFGFGWLVGRMKQDPIPIRWQTILSWGGLRGAICLALALSLPVTLGPGRDQLRIMAFGVVLFTLLFQSTTMRFLVGVFHIQNRNEDQREQELRHVRKDTLRAAEALITQKGYTDTASPTIWQKLQGNAARNILVWAQRTRQALRRPPDKKTDAIETAYQELLGAQRSILLDLRHDGVISDDIYRQLSAEVNESLGEFLPMEYEPDDASAQTEFLHIYLEKDSEYCGKTIADIHFPQEAVLVSIRRQSRILIPRGKTRLHAGDILTVLARKDMTAKLRTIFS